MNKQEALGIVEGLRNATAQGGAVNELPEKEARNFAFVRDRAEVLASFRVEVGQAFFVSLASSSSEEGFQIFFFDGRKRGPFLMSSQLGPDGVVWTYQPAKRSGDNQARKRAFFDAAQSTTVSIPLPASGLRPFSEAVARAFELRRVADATGGEEGVEADASELLEQLYPQPSDRSAAAARLFSSIRRAHGFNPKSWCVTNPRSEQLVRLNVGVVRVLDLVQGHIRIAVDVTRLDEATRLVLGPRLDLVAEHIDSFEGGGAVIEVPSALSQLPPNVWDAHDAFIESAAPSTSPFARHHRAEIVAAVERIVGGVLPVPAATTTRYWKVSPGENGEMWLECRNGGFIAMGWDSLGDLTGVDQEEFKHRAETVDASDQVWKFRNIEEGDRIVANNGISRVLGIGTVTGPYYFASGAKRSHRLPVRWDDITERVVEMKGWRKTLIRLNQETFEHLQAAPQVADMKREESSRPIVGEAAPTGGIDFEGILAELANKHLTFPAELVASYLLALQAKRFVMLTGISGTGKTRLAQEVARAFGASFASDVAPDDETVEVIAKPSQVKRGRFIVPAALAREFELLTDPEERRIDLQIPGQPISSMAFHRNSDGGNLLYVLLSGEARDWFKSNIKVGDRYLLARRTDGEREWLQLQLPEAGKRASQGPTYELVAVRPDWTDSRPLLGFFNPLTRSYARTPTLDLLLRAEAEAQRGGAGNSLRPYFLIFDEMNLARVEHYFSDFLSAMESGEAIPLHEDAGIEEAEGVPRRMKIPNNIFVVGTVNVDETTYMFSPKVLDRSFVLEFNEVDLDGLSGKRRSEDAESTALALSRLEGGLELRGNQTDTEWHRFEQVLGGTLGRLIREVHAALEVDNRHFGYRVASEIARFVDLAMEQTNGSEAAARAAFDVAVFAKVLPKLHGAQAELEPALDRLIAISLGGKLTSEAFDSRGSLTSNAEDVPMPRTARKLWRMQRRLRLHGFASFIE